MATYFPCEKLKPYVRTFTVIESALESTYSVLPDTVVVMGFQFKGRLYRLQQNSKTSLSTSGITGLRDSYNIFMNAAATGTVLVTFQEGGAAKFFKEPIHELFRDSISLENFMLRSELLILEERLCEANTNLKRLRVVEDFLICRMRDVKTDGMVATAIALIHRHKGNVRIHELMEKLNISQSPLEKRFRQIVGTSPKKFASIVRFKHTIKTYDADRSLTELGYEAGFYDQAHFVKEFRNFTGQSPEQFFKDK